MSIIIVIIVIVVTIIIIIVITIMFHCIISHQKKTPRVRSGTFVLASRWSMHVRPRGASAPA